MVIPFFDLKAQLLTIEDEIKSTVNDVLDSGWFVLGERLERFEGEFASYCGAAYGIGVGSGTEALHLALVAAGVGPGDEVVTVPNTAVPTISAIRFAGARPVFVDIDPSTYTIDPVKLSTCLRDRAEAGGRVKAVVPVHLYGQSADMGAVLEICKAHSVPVIEDACQAHGTEDNGKKAGSMGLMGCFSFYPSKNLGAYGDGGFVTTSDPLLADSLKELRNYGQKERYDSVSEGFNSRLDEVQAAVLSVKLKYLDNWVDRRNELASLYDSLIDHEKVTLPVTRDSSRHARHLYVIRHPERDALMAYLKENGVSTLIHYPIPVHMQQAYRWLGLGEGSFTEAEKAAREILSLPLYPELTDQDVRSIARLINEFTK